MDVNEMFVYAQVARLNCVSQQGAGQGSQKVAHLEENSIKKKSPGLSL
jgi:hypothetical protein